MRLSRLEARSGNVLLVVLLAMPFLVAALALVIDVGQLGVARARLQSAADRAATVGAAGLAHSLNRIAAENWRLHRAWRDLEGEFTRSSERDRATADAAIAAYERRRDIVLDRIDAVAMEMCPRAEALAVRLAEANAPAVEAWARTAGCFSPARGGATDREEGSVGFAAIAGTTFIDPEDVETGGYRGVRFLRRRRLPLRVGVHLRQTLRPLLLPSIFGEAVVVRADAAAQAYGGSIEAFAAKATGTLAEAATDVDAVSGMDGLYRFSLVPRWTMGNALEEER